MLPPHLWRSSQQEILSRQLALPATQVPSRRSTHYEPRAHEPPRAHEDPSSGAGAMAARDPTSPKARTPPSLETPPSQL